MVFINPAIIILLFLPLFITVFQDKKKVNINIETIIKNRKDRKRALHMKEILQSLINKDCHITTIKSECVGIIKEVTDTAVVIENYNIRTIINIEFIITVKEVPLNKKGKRKAIY